MGLNHRSQRGKQQGVSRRRTPYEKSFRHMQLAIGSCENGFGAENGEGVVIEVADVIQGPQADIETRRQQANHQGGFHSFSASERRHTSYPPMKGKEISAIGTIP